MVINVKSDVDISTLVQAAVERHGATVEALVPILTDVNRALGFLPQDAMTAISRSLRIPASQVLSTASFYQMLSTRPRGKHIIKFCESAPCHVVGGRLVWKALQDALGLEPGETSTDGQWTLLTTSCPGVCGVSPVLIIDDEVHGNVTPEKIPELLAQYQEGGQTQ